MNKNSIPQDYSHPDEQMIFLNQAMYMLLDCNMALRCCYGTSLRNQALLAVFQR